MGQKVYRVSVIPGYVTLAPIDSKGCEDGDPLVIELAWGSAEELVPHALVSALMEKGERFMGSLPGKDCHYYVVTEPIAPAPPIEAAP
jgi:hypothetical protein